ncbi:BatD family protein [Zhongshania sp. BJYM1]|uniref:BatD family protein n=1 Tax=Zhongshania aquatica TaxID=2965069 RepID=UPI0022B42F7B|nr:BatD family protein [Marortus sp. BJYM1]
MMQNRSHNIFTQGAAILGLLVVLLCQAGFAHAETNVRATVDRSQVSSEESFTLSLTADSILFSGEPDVNALEKDFHIINRQQSSRTNIINGKVNSSRQWDYTLVPKREGTLTIPALPMGKYKTRAITITVSKAAKAQQTGNESMYMESDVSPRTAYVQQELQYTVKIFTSVNILDASLDAPEVDNAVVEADGEERYQSLINGRYFQVIERRYSIYPQTSGNLTIPALTLQARVEGYRPSMLDPGRLVVKRSSEHRIKVLPPPAEFKGAVWLPAKEIALEESWSKNPDTLKVGDSITRTVNIKADGLLGSQLPALPTIELNNAKLYPDQAKIEKGDDKSNWTGIRSESLAIIPTHAGEFVLPEVRIAWWNTDSDRAEFAVLPERKFTVAPALSTSGETGAASSNSLIPNTPTIHNKEANEPVNTNAADALSDQTSSNSVFMWVVVALLLLSNLGFAVAWWRGRHRSSATPITPEMESNSESKAFKVLEKSVKTKAAYTELRSTLSKWGQCYCKRPVTLSELGNAIPELRTFCQKLDAHLFSGHDIDFDTNALLDTVKSVRSKGTVKGQTRPALAPLYR